MAALYWFKTFLLVSLVLTIPFFNYAMDVEGFQGGMQAKYSFEQGGMNLMGSSISRKLLMEGAMLDYDDTGANTKHEPRKKPGKP